MKFVSLLDIQIDGELKMRAGQNYARLHRDEFRPEVIFRDQEYSWPADFEGRALLALTVLAQTLNVAGANAHAIMRQLPSHLNSQGYMGPKLPKGLHDEQCLSGHGWLLRGLMEYYLWCGNNVAQDMAEGIVNKLFLPLRGAYEQYPLDPGSRKGGGEAIGSRADVLDGWRLSTDVGCAFIPIDGLSQVYCVMPSNDLRLLLVEMITRFTEADKKGLQMQTHATLSALRGVLRFYEATRLSEYLDIVQETFDLYLREGITENNENYNWFGRPEWTEPCAVVDSFMLAMGLWKHLGDEKYLELAQEIYYNGLGYEQRPNGGFGCNSCSGAQDAFVKPVEELFEAWWCCSMRGGEGLSRAAESIWAYRNFKDKGESTPIAELSVLFYFNNTAHIELSVGKLEIQMRTEYPYDGQIDIAILESQVTRSVRLRFFIPDWVAEDQIALTQNRAPVAGERKNGFYEALLQLESGDKLFLSFPITLHTRPTRNVHSLPGYQTLRHGPMILGTRMRQRPVVVENPKRLAYFGHAVYRDKTADFSLAPINDLINLEPKDAVKDQRQILFAVKP